MFVKITCKHRICFFHAIYIIKAFIRITNIICLHQCIKNTSYNQCNIVTVNFEFFIVINCCIIKIFYFFKHFIIFITQPDSLLRRAVPTYACYKIMDYNCRIYRFNTILLWNLCQLINLFFTNKINPDCIFYISSEICNFIGNFYNAALPCIRLKLSRFAKCIQIYFFFSWKDTVLINLSAVWNYTVPDCIRKVKIFQLALIVFKQFNIVYYSKTVSFMPESVHSKVFSYSR